MPYAKSPIECNLSVYAAGNPISFVDPSGNTPQLIGGEIGAGVAAYSAHNDNMTGASFWQAIPVGGVTGALAGTGIGGAAAGSFLSAVGNVATQQLQEHESINWTSVGVSALASLAGSAAGSLADKFAHLTQPVINESLEFVAKSGEYSTARIGNVVGGFVGGAAEMAGQSMVPTACTLNNSHSGTWNSSSSNFQPRLEMNSTPVNGY